MLNKCSIFGCNSNYGNQAYLKLFSFPTDEVERNHWIDAVPNERSSLLELKRYLQVNLILTVSGFQLKGGGEKDQANHHPSFLVYKSLA